MGQFLRIERHSELKSTVGFAISYFVYLWKMKIIFFILLMGMTCFLQAQQFVCKNGKVHFFSKAPLEDIEANTTQAVCALNTETGKIFAKIPVNTFRFKEKLMEEHFNENYLESDKIPYATLDAAIQEKIDYTKDGEYPITLTGMLNIHAVKKAYTINGKLTVKNGVPVVGTAEFSVVLVDHKIKIPKVVVMNIAEVIKVNTEFAFEQYQKP